MTCAASCFYQSPFEEAAILTVDGVGEHRLPDRLRQSIPGGNYALQISVN